MDKLRLTGLALVVALAGCTSFNCDHFLQKTFPGDASTSQQPVCVLTDSQEYQPENLVFQGGGVKGIAYAGALQVLHEQQILELVDGVAGTSAGAITATLLALGYSPGQVRQLLLNLDFSRFEDGSAGGLFRLFRRYGYYRGDYFLDVMQCLVKHKTDDPHLTLADLAKARSGDRPSKLQLYTTNLSSGAARELSADCTGDLEVAMAARMSMSIPLFFASITDDHRIFVDGGVLNNYPIRAFDQSQQPGVECPDKGIDARTELPETNESSKPETLGFVLTDVNAPPKAPITGFFSYGRALLETVLNVQVESLRRDRPNLARTAVLDDLGVATTDFHLSHERKLELIASGAKCTCDFLSDRKEAVGNDPLLSATLNNPEPVPLRNFKQCGWVLD